jgi:hypothetical protein
VPHLLLLHATPIHPRRPWPPIYPHLILPRRTAFAAACRAPPAGRHPACCTQVHPPCCQLPATNTRCSNTLPTPTLLRPHPLYSLFAAAMHAQRSCVLHTHSTTCPWPFFFSTPRQTHCPVRPRIRFCTECLGLPPPLHPALPPHPASHLVVAAAAGNSRFEALHHPHFVSLAHTFPARPTRPPGFPSQGGQRGSTATLPCSCKIALSY